MSTEYYYDQVGNMKVEKITGGSKINYKIYVYDAMNRVVSVSDAIAAVKSGFNEEQLQTAANAEENDSILKNMKKSVVYVYDILGNKKAETTTREFKAYGNNDIITYEYTYDALNRPETVKDQTGKIVSTKIYDANGNVIESIDAMSNVTQYKYNLANSVAEVIDPETNHYAARYEYNQYGQKEKQYDGLENKTEYRYDNAGSLVKVIDGKDVETEFAWDKAGSKLSMTDGRDKVTHYFYGSGGLLLSMTDADEKTTAYQYDLVGNITKIVDKNGKEITNQYDNRNLLICRKAADAEVRYVYNVFGNRISMAYGNTDSTSYCYDNYHRLEQIKDKNGDEQLRYNYDDMGNMTKVIVNQSFITDYQYDICNRMWKVTSGGKTTEYLYDDNGNRKSIKYHGGVHEEFDYYKNNRLKRVINYATAGNTSIISKYEYVYDLAGRQKSKTDSYGTTEYRYDACGRIESVTGPGKTTVYNYDNAGNRLSLNETYNSQQQELIPRYQGKQDITYKIKTSNYFYSNANKLLKTVETMFAQDGNTIVLTKAIKYTYDDNGNQMNETVEYAVPSTGAPASTEASLNLSIVTDESQTGFDTVIETMYNNYDGFNRLISTESIKDGVKTKTEFAYNGDDLRIEKKVIKGDEPPKATKYFYNGMNVIMETDQNNNATSYVRGLGYIGRRDATGKQSYYLYNGHGDAVQTVKEDGTVENQYDYDIFGNPILTVEEGGYSNAIRYSGEFYDQETGLYYLRARYYDSYTGRFVSEDSYWGEDSNPLSLNLYTYAENDPINFIDPTGHAKAVNGEGETIEIPDDVEVDVIGAENGKPVVRRRKIRDMKVLSAKDYNNTIYNFLHNSSTKKDEPKTPSVPDNTIKTRINMGDTTIEILEGNNSTTIEVGKALTALLVKALETGCDPQLIVDTVVASYKGASNQVSNDVALDQTWEKIAYTQEKTKWAIADRLLYNAATKYISLKSGENFQTVKTGAEEAGKALRKQMERIDSPITPTWLRNRINYLKNQYYLNLDKRSEISQVGQLAWGTLDALEKFAKYDKELTSAARQAYFQWYKTMGYVDNNEKALDVILTNVDSQTKKNANDALVATITKVDKRYAELENPKSVVVPNSQTQVTGAPGEMVLSEKGLKRIADFELSEDIIKSWGLGVYDENGNLTGIYPHYVFKNVGTDKNPQWVSDGGITFGYGHYVSKGEYEDVSSSERALVDKYAKGAPILPLKTPSNGVPYRVPGSSPVPMAEVNRLYREDLAGSAKTVNRFLSTNKIPLKQHQFDMLVSFTHNYGSGWWTSKPEKLLPKYIREGKGNYDPKEVIRIFELHDNKGRRTIEANIFNNGYDK